MHPSPAPVLVHRLSLEVRTNCWGRSLRFQAQNQIARASVALWGCASEFSHKRAGILRIAIDGLAAGAGAKKTVRRVVCSVEENIYGGIVGEHCRNLRDCPRDRILGGILPSSENVAQFQDLALYRCLQKLD